MVDVALTIECWHTGAPGSSPDCEECMSTALDILARVRAGKVSASMSGMEYYSECQDAAIAKLDTD